MRTITLVTIFAICISCSKNSGPHPTKLLVGINDSAVYHFDRDGRTSGVEKLDLLSGGAYTFLHRDTVKLGEDFRAHFGIWKDEFEIIITKPTQITLTKADQDKLGKEEPFIFEYKPTERGLYEFEGEFRFDSTILPFHWKFIVI